MFLRNRPLRPSRLRDVENPTLSRQSAHRQQLGCQSHAPAAHGSIDGYGALLQAGRSQVQIPMR
jgi:hypothetical protein